MQNLFFLIKSKIFGVECGQDLSGNRYFHHKNNPQKRWVIYKGNNEATKVSPQWHGWLHGYLDAPLDEDAPSFPNMTGTSYAHNPDKTPYPHKSKIKTWKPN
ncbi:MAG: hypothetical protein NEHIOOID_00142 [Holosporales bacterium]